MHFRNFCRMAPVVPTLALAAILMAGGSKPALACTENSYAGTICYTAANYCPDSFIPADGRSLPVNGYQVLYSLFGDNYGSVQAGYFNVPDLRGRSLIGPGLGGGLTVNTPFPQKRGAESVTLTIANLATHNHPVGGAISLSGVSAGIPVLAAPGTLSVPSASGNVYPAGLQIDDADQNVQYFGPYTQNVPNGLVQMPVTFNGVAPMTGATGNTGVGQPFALFPPQIAVTVCISNLPIYPPRPQ